MRVRSFIIIGIVLTAALMTTYPAASPGASGPITARIINGTSVSPTTYSHRWNFIVRLVDPAEFQVYPYSGFCGGSLISSRLVLTAAHCVTDTNDFTGVTTITKPLAIQVVANGGPSLPSDGSETRIPVTRITVHPNFDGHTLDNDLALIQLGAPPQSSDWSPISIVDQAGLGGFGDEQWGDGLGKIGSTDGPWTAGWGNKSTNPDPQHGTYSRVLDQVEIPIHSDTACRTNFVGTDTTNPFHHATMICAGTNVRDDHDPLPKDTCQGDSGGPLIVWAGAAGDPADGTQYDEGSVPGSTPANYRLAGLTSWGFDCAGDTYGVYTRIGAFRSWIDSTGIARAGNLQDPTAATATAPTVTSQLISWVAPAGGDIPAGYHVYAQDGTSYRLAATVGSGVTSAIADKLHGGRGSRFYVTSIDAVGHESFGSMIVAGSTLPDLVRPTHPGRPVMSGRTARRIAFRWGASRDNDAVLRYEVWMRGKSQSRYRRVAFSLSPKYLRAKLAPHSYYVVKVRAIDFSGRASAFSPTRLLRTR